MDKQSEVTYSRLIRTLNTIKRTCKNHEKCEDCMFYFNYKTCFFDTMKHPENWDVNAFDDFTMQRMNKIIGNVFYEIFGFGGDDNGHTINNNETDQEGKRKEI